MVHEQQRGEENLWPMIRYAQAHGNDAVCKAIMLDNLGEPNAPNPTQVQRENDGLTTDTRNVGTHGQTVTRILHEKCLVGDDVTM
jgi:ATP-dependent DNA helicase Q1